MLVSESLLRVLAAWAQGQHWQCGQAALSQRAVGGRAVRSLSTVCPLLSPFSQELHKAGQSPLVPAWAVLQLCRCLAMYLTGLDLTHWSGPPGLVLYLPYCLWTWLLVDMLATCSWTCSALLVQGLWDCADCQSGHCPRCLAADLSSGSPPWQSSLLLLLLLWWSPMWSQFHHC